MPKLVSQKSDAVFRTANLAKFPSGRVSDGGGLFMLIGQDGSKKWRFQYTAPSGKRNNLAFGDYPAVGAAEARRKAQEARELLEQGIDPSQAKKEAKLATRIAAANSFQAVAEEWLAMKRKTWATNTADKAETHFKEYVFPEIGQRPISELKAPHYLDMLRKIEKRIPYTATRLREQCSQVCRYAIATHRLESNPVADLKGALATPKTQNRPAITDRREFGVFLRDFNDARMSYVTRAATRFAMLTFTRAQEMRFAKWEEFDWDAAEWKVPAIRMKRGKDRQAHTVPLAKQTLALLRELQQLTGSTPYLFPNAHGADGVISENTIGKALNEMGYQGRQCAHGFRATARSLLAEQGWSREAMERQLDHAEGNKVVAAYARAEHLEERRRMMQAWADLLDGLESGAEVIPIHRAA